MAQVQILYVATARGLNQYANPGTSDRWRAVGVALNDQDVAAVRASVSDPLHALAGSAAGLSATTNGGASWELVHAAPSTSLVATSGGVYAGTTDGKILRETGDEWVTVYDGSPAVTRLAGLRTERVAAIYEDGSLGLLDGDAFKPIGDPAPGALAVVSSAAAPDELFVITGSGVHGSGGFQAVDDNLTGAAVLLAGKPEVLLLGSGQAILRSEDGGSSFAPVEGPVDVRVLVSPARYQDYAYAGTASGELWLSSDRGRSWRMLHSGLAPIHDLSFARVF